MRSTVGCIYIKLAVDITGGCGLHNEGYREFLSKKSKVMVYLLFIK